MTYQTCAASETADFFLGIRHGGLPQVFYDLKAKSSRPREFSTLDVLLFAYNEALSLIHKLTRICLELNDELR